MEKEKEKEKLMSSAKENGPKRPSSSSNGNSDSADKGPADPKSSGAVFSLANHNKPGVSSSAKRIQKGIIDRF